MLNRLRYILTVAAAAVLCMALVSCTAEDRHSPPDVPPPAVDDGTGIPDGSQEPPQDEEETGDGQDPPPADPQMREIDAAIAEMSPAEKLGQLVMIGVEGEQMDETVRALIEDRHAGGVIMYGRNLGDVEQAVRLINDLKQANKEAGGLPLLIGVDEEGGTVTRLPEALTPTPSSRDVGLQGDSAWTFGLGEVIGEKVAAFGINVNFAPVLDIDSNPDNPVIGERSFGSDADAVGSLGVAEMQGMAQHVVPVVKHFPGHGDTDTDSHVNLPVVNHDADRLRSFELQPFMSAIRNGADAVMVAHLLVPAFDDQYPASMSEPIITDLLREELGFDGVVITDDMTMGAIAEHYDFSEAVVRSVLAGSDQILIGHGYDRAIAAIEALEQAYLSGELTEARIDESLRRILLLKLKYGISDESVAPVDVDAINAQTEEILNAMPSS